MSSYLTFKRLNSNRKAMVIASVFTPGINVYMKYMCIYCMAEILQE